MFVHGGFSDSWYWEPYFLPWFAAQGYAAHALSLRGHGTSGGKDSLFVAGLDDYAADVERIAAQLPEAPVLIGHSMGAAVIERLLSTRPVRAAGLLAPVPPAGLLVVAARLAAERPESVMGMMQADPARLTRQVLNTLKPYYFSRDVDPEIMAQAMRHISQESPRALFDLSLRLHWQSSAAPTSPVLVLGAMGDRICTPDDVQATARHHSVEPVMVEGLAHMLMLERQWQSAARILADWLATLT
ncbi:MAG: lysophospholipase [Pseudomonadota bacterium]|nr:lysophospholipase [Pseudomonadota bacterium]